MAGTKTFSIQCMGWTTLILLSSLSGYNATAHAKDTDSKHIPIPDRYAYPGTVLWYTADHPHVLESGAVIDVGREAFTLPRFVLDYAKGDLHLRPGQVGDSACLIPGGKLTFALHPEETLVNPLRYHILSVAFWIKPAALSSEPVTLYSSHFSSKSGIEITASTQQTALRAWDDDKDWEISLAGKPLQPDAWSHLVMSLDASSEEAARYGLHFYIDNQQHGPVETQLFVDPKPELSFHAPASSDTSAEFCFDEVAVYIDPLTRHSVSDLFTYGLGRGDPEVVDELRREINKKEQELADAEQERHFKNAPPPSGDGHGAHHGH